VRVTRIKKFFKLPRFLFCSRQKGSITLLAIISLALIIVSIPVTIKLVQQRQEIRKEAVYPETPCKICQNGLCKDSGLAGCSHSDDECATQTDCQLVSPSPSIDTQGYSCANEGCVPRGNQFATLLECNKICGMAGVSPSPSPSCKGENESCSSTGNCCGGLNCASLPGGKFCVAPTCSGGAERCSGNFVQECQNGVWTDIQRCDAGCDPNTTSCKKACSAGEKRCVGDVLETCAANGSGWSGKSCSYGCANNACVVAPSPSPSPATCVCSGGFWSGRGCSQWQAGMPCQTIPSPSPRASIVPSPFPSPFSQVCYPRTTRCVGSDQEICTGDGSGWSTRGCSYGCSSGSCLSPPTTLPSPSLPPGCSGQGGSCDIKDCCPGYACTGPHLTCAVSVGGGCTSDSDCGLCFGSSARACLNRQCVFVKNDPYCLQQQQGGALLAQSLFGVEMIGFAVVGAYALPGVATAAYVGGQAALATAPSWAQTAVGLGLPAAELAGTSLAALECSLGNQDACMMGMLGGLAYTEQAMVGKIARSGVDDFVNWEAEYQRMLADRKARIEAALANLETGNVTQQAVVEHLEFGHMFPHATLETRYTGNPTLVNALDRWLIENGLEDVVMMDVGASTGKAYQSLIEEFTEYNVSGAALDINFPDPHTVADVDFIQGNASSLPFGTDTVDVLIEANFWGYYDNYPAALEVIKEEASRVLSPGGLLIGGMDDVTPNALGLEYYVNTPQGLVPFQNIR